LEEECNWWVPFLVCIVMFLMPTSVVLCQCKKLKTKRKKFFL
jgi:hypothetical protein